MVLFVPFFGRNEPFWEVLEFEISMQEPNFEPFSWFGPSIFGVKKSKCEFTKNHRKRASYLYEMTHLENAYLFEISSTLILALCFLPSAARRQKILSREARFQGF